MKDIIKIDQENNGKLWKTMTNFRKEFIKVFFKMQYMKLYGIFFYKSYRELTKITSKKERKQYKKYL